MHRPIAQQLSSVSGLAPGSPAAAGDLPGRTGTSRGSRRAALARSPHQPRGDLLRPPGRRRMNDVRCPVSVKRTDCSSHSAERCETLPPGNNEEESKRVSKSKSVQIVIHLLAIGG